MKGAESRGDHTHWAWPGGRGEGSEVEKWSVEDESGEVRGQEVSYRIDCTRNGLATPRTLYT